MRRSASSGSAREAENAGEVLDPAALAPRRGGRPSRLEAERLREKILDAATDLFLTHGYGTTSIEAVAQRAHMSKRTFYHRFDNKAALFGAVVHRIVDQLRPPTDVPLLDGGNLQEILERLARLILRAALSSQALALHRLVVGESARFPELAVVATEQSRSQEAVKRIAELLEREVRTERLALDNPTFAAQQFLQMVVSLPQRRAMGLGLPMTPIEFDAWARDTVNLFLNGCRGWSRMST